MKPKDIREKVIKFEEAAHKIFGIKEASQSRVIHLTDTYDKLGKLSVKQDDVLRQALRCIEVEVFRGAHVLSWAALVDYLQEFSAVDSFVALNAARPKWNITNVEDLRENHAEYNFIDGLFVAGLILKNEKKAFHGLLTRRNECAHPSTYYPDLNETLGYVSEIMKRIDTHKKRTQPTL